MMTDFKAKEGEPLPGSGSGGTIAGSKIDASKTNSSKKPNPMWKYMGFGENFRPRLPSRNWTIFLTVTGTFTAAVIYDKREKKRAQRKWCKLVEHVAKEPLDPRAMPRKLTIFLEGPPTDGLRVAQDHFKEYVKPILVASGLDWDFVQGRKEGDIRYEVAERIRNARLPPDTRFEGDPVAEARRRGGITDFDGPKGDIVIGRHTWKEYVRGLHEGWLGPLVEPPRPVVESSDLMKSTNASLETLPGITIHSSEDEAKKAILGASAAAESTEATDVALTDSKIDEKPAKPSQLLPFITTFEYPSIPTPAPLPWELDPCAPISFPHILGFLNTPKRLYRFLNRRVLADQIGRETAAVILSTYRPFSTLDDRLAGSSYPEESSSSPQSLESDQQMATVRQMAEQQTALIGEEREWHKNARIRTNGEPERTWLDPVVLDPRIASRMRRFEITPEEEAKARSIIVPEEEIEGWIKGSMRSLVRTGMQYFGYERFEQVELIEDESML